VIILAYFWWTPILALIAGLLAFYGAMAVLIWVLNRYQRRTNGRINPPRPRFG
jgi:hypothetical protein